MLDSNNLPRSWQVKTLGEVCDIIMGQSPLGEKVINKSQNTDSKALEFHQGKICFTDKFISESEVVTTDIRKIAPKDSILLCVRAPVGVVNITQRRIAIGRGLCALNLKDSSNNFLYFYLLTLNNYFNQKATGSTFSAINLDTIKNTKIPIPPLEIQKRIVKRLDEAFSRIESGTKHLQSAKDNLTKYKQSLLKSAFNGTLTQDCPLLQGESTHLTHPLAPSAREGEKESCHPTTNEKQKTIHAFCHTDSVHCHTERSEVSKSKGADFVDTSAFSKPQYDKVLDSRNDEDSPSLAEGVRGWVNPRNDNALDCHADKSARNDDKDLLNDKSANLPQSWVIKTLGEVCEFAYGKGLESAKRNTNGKYPVYAANGIKDYSDEYMIKEPSIIVGRKGSVGSLVLTNTPCWVLDVSYYVVFDKEQYDLMFLYHLLKTLNLNQYARGVKPGLSRSQAYELKVKIPPLETQKQIVAVLERHFTSADKVGVYIDSCLTKAKQLKSSLLKSAFEGKLV